jgi:hypothetical protein
MTDQTIPLPLDWDADEKGNTWLVDEACENHVAWFDLPGTPLRRLEVAVTPGNSPGFEIQVLTPEHSTNEHLARHINTKLKGWHIRRCNIDGVVCFGAVNGGLVMGYKDVDEENEG